VPTEKSGSQKHVGESSPLVHQRHHPDSWHPVSGSVGPGQYRCVSAGQSGSSGSSQPVAEEPVPTEKSGSQKHVGESSPLEHIRHHPDSWHPVSESVGPGQYKCVSAGQSGSSGSSQLVAVAEGPVPTEKSGSQKHVGESSPFEHIRHHPGSWHPVSGLVGPGQYLCVSDGHSTGSASPQPVVAAEAPATRSDSRKRNLMMSFG